MVITISWQKIYFIHTYSKLVFLLFSAQLLDIYIQAFALMRAKEEKNIRKINGTYQEIFWLDVSVHNVETMEVFECAGQIVDHCTPISLCIFCRGSDSIK